MKNKPLSIQIWLVFAAMTVIIALALSLILPWTLRNFFTQEMYANIEESQAAWLNIYTARPGEGYPGMVGQHRQHRQELRTITHFLIVPGRQQVIPAMPLPKTFLQQVMQQAGEQKIASQRYSTDAAGDKIFYVVSRVEAAQNSVFLVSYMLDAYREDVVYTLLRQILFIMFLVLLLSWVPSLILARYVSRPLTVLGKKVKSLSQRNWEEPIELQRSDEIGQLGASIELLRRQLMAQDEAQQSFLQHVSHELKTPVMVIRSYSEAIRDGIFPRGDLVESTRVIENEAARLEQGIQNLLYLTKLDYLAGKKPKLEMIELETIIRGVVERFRMRRPEIEWSLQLTPVQVAGDQEQLQVMLENLLDNQIRYAVHRISIDLNRSGGVPAALAHLRICNDGPPIDKELQEVLFEKYHKGTAGKMGLGLAIVQGILALHRGEISQQNEEAGVCFYINLPLPANSFGGRLEDPGGEDPA